MTKAGPSSLTARRSTAGRSTAVSPSMPPRTGPSSARRWTAARTPSCAGGTTMTSCSNWRSGATPGSTRASRSAATSTRRMTRTRRTSRVLGSSTACRARSPVKRPGRRGDSTDEGRRLAKEIKPGVAGRLPGRRLEPLSDRGPGEPLQVVDQRDRRLRLHRRHGQERLHRPPGPRRPQGRGPIRSAGGNILCIKELEVGEDEFAPTPPEGLAVFNCRDLDWPGGEPRPTGRSRTPTLTGKAGYIASGSTASSPGGAARSRTFELRVKVSVLAER